MDTERKELRVDRIEDGLAIAYDASGNEYCMCAKIADLQESDVLLAAINKDGAVVDARVQHEKTNEIKQSLKSRLQSLFDR